MTFDFIEGKITKEQFTVPQEMRAEQIASLEEGQWCYVNPGAVWMDKDSLLWVDASSQLYEPESVPDYVIDEMPRLLRLPEGLILDVSHCHAIFESFTDDQLAFIRGSGPEYATKDQHIRPEPIIQLIEKELERGILEEVLSKTYCIDYPEVASEVSDQYDSDED